MAMAPTGTYIFRQACIEKLPRIWLKKKTNEQNDSDNVNDDDDSDGGGGDGGSNDSDFNVDEFNN